MRNVYLTCLLFLAACSKNPVTGKSEVALISESQEIEIGESNYAILQQGEGGAYVTLPSVQKYVEKVGRKLAAVSDRPQLPYQFVVLNNSIPNAWSLPGGKIGINRGLLVELKSEAELAAVLGHEIVHSAARHGAKNLEKSILLSAGLYGMSQILADHKYEDVAIGAAQVGAGLVIMKYSRNAEFEADQYGMKYMEAAGYDPQAAVDLQKTFLRLSKNGDTHWLAGFFASHPPTPERVAANEKTAAEYPTGGKIGTKEYQQAIGPLQQKQQAYEALDAGYAALQQGKISDALSFAEKGIRIEPQEAHLYNLRGKAQKSLGKPQEALSSFTRAIDLYPYYFDFYLERGGLKFIQGDLKSARKDLLKSIELLPSAEAYFTLGEIATHQGDEEEAVDYFKKASVAQNNAGEAARKQLKDRGEL